MESDNKTRNAEVARERLDRLAAQSEAIEMEAGNRLGNIILSGHAGGIATTLGLVTAFVRSGTDAALDPQLAWLLTLFVIGAVLAGLAKCAEIVRMYSRRSAVHRAIQAGTDLPPIADLRQLGDTFYSKGEHLITLAAGTMYLTSGLLLLSGITWVLISVHRLAG